MKIVFLIFGILAPSFAALLILVEIVVWRRQMGYSPYENLPESANAIGFAIASGLCFVASAIVQASENILHALRRRPMAEEIAVPMASFPGNRGAQSHRHRDENDL